MEIPESSFSEFHCACYENCDMALAMTVQSRRSNSHLTKRVCRVLTLACAVGLLSCGKGRLQTNLGTEYRVTRAGEVEIWKVGQKGTPRSGHPRARDGDWVLRGAGLTVIVAGANRDPRRRFPAGSIIGVIVEGVQVDTLRAWRTVVEAGGERVRFLKSSFKPEVWDDRAFLTIERESENRSIVERTRISLAPTDRAVMLETMVNDELEMGGEEAHALDVITWPGGFSFVPEVGFVTRPTTTSAPWIARKGNRTSCAFVPPPGGAKIVIPFEPHGPDDVLVSIGRRALDETGVSGRERRLVFGAGGLEAVVAQAWEATGVEVGEIVGTVRPRQKWAVIDASPPGKGPVISVEAEPDGDFRMPVRLGAYDVKLRTLGGSDVERAEVTLGAPRVRVDFEPPPPGKVKYRVVDGDGDPLPARILLRGLPPTKDPVLGPNYVARGAGNAVYTATGKGKIELPKGRYDVVVTHGPEYNISRHRISVAGKTGSSFVATLRRVVDTRGWIAADFHLHAEPSYDSSVTLEDRVTSLVAEGVEFAVATDHNIVTDYAIAIDDLGLEALLAGAPGVEVTTWDPQWGHFNTWPWDTTWPIPPFSRQTPEGIFEAIRFHAAGAVIQVNHPRMDEHNVGYFTIAELDAVRGVFRVPVSSSDFDAVEVINGMDLGKPDLIESNLREWLTLLKAGQRYTATGNSDSHYLISQWAGFPRTYVKVSDDRPSRIDAREVADAVRFGRAIVTTGPFLRVSMGDYGLGDMVEVINRTARVEVEVTAPSWIDVTLVEILVDGKVVATHRVKPLPGKTTRVAFHKIVHFTKDAFVVVVARGERSMEEVLPGRKILPLAFTNPIYVDVDADGAWCGLPARGSPAEDDLPSGVK